MGAVRAGVRPSGSKPLVQGVECPRNAVAGALAERQAFPQTALPSPLPFNGLGGWAIPLTSDVRTSSRPVQETEMRSLMAPDLYCLYHSPTWLK
jgi:hypothetical protein